MYHYKRNLCKTQSRTVGCRKKAALSVFLHLPKASCVEWLAALQSSLQILKIIRELLILSELHHVIEVLHMLDDCIQLDKAGESVNEHDESRNTF